MIFLWVHFVFGYIGHYGFDDMEYARLAWGIAQGNFEASNHFSYRLALLLPTALSYLIFGVNDLASSFPPLLAASATLYFIALFLKDQPKEQLLIALTLTVLSPWFLRYSAMLMPDIYVCLAVLASFYFLWQREIQSKSRFPAIGLAASLFFGFMAKGTIVLIFPVLAIFFLIDLTKRRNQGFWAVSISASLLLLLIYFATIYWVTGDALMRFKVIGENSYLNRCSYAEQGAAIVLKRISVDFLRMLQSDFILWYFLILLPPILYWIRKKELKINSLPKFLLLAAVLLLISSNFSSISLKAYNPMCLDIRHYLFLIPLGGLAVSQLLFSDLTKKLKWIFSAIIILSAAICYHFENTDLFLWVLPVSAVLLFFFAFQGSGRTKSILLFALPLSMLAKPIKMMQDAQLANYEGRRDFIIDKLLSGEEEKLIWTDPVQQNLGNYYLGFDQSRIRFKDFRSYEPELNQRVPNVYYLKNWHTAQQSFITASQIPISLKKAANQPAEQEDLDLAISLYRLDRNNSTHLFDVQIFKEHNDFEAKVDKWTGNTVHLTPDPLSAKNQVSKVGLYSSTLKVELDSLLNQEDEYLINARCSIYVEEATQAKLVISIENMNQEGEQESLFYSSQEADPLIGSYGNWWEIELEDLIKLNKLDKSTTLKVYIWNVDQKLLYLDDMQFEIHSQQKKNPEAL